MRGMYERGVMLSISVLMRETVPIMKESSSEIARNDENEHQCRARNALLTIK